MWFRRKKPGRLAAVLPHRTGWTDFPREHEADRERFCRLVAAPAARQTYIMFFTPRSGSSWLADIAAASGRLGTPSEAFNPNFLPKMVRAFGTRSMDEYCEVLRRRRHAGGIMGFQITWHQLNRVFRDDGEPFRRFPDAALFWLIREDIVAQAVSLYKMVETGVAHAPHSSEAAIREADAALEYDGKRIRKWLDHILQAEERTEAILSERGPTPLRMSYERNLALGAGGVISAMCAHLGIDGNETAEPPASDHRRIATEANRAFAARFREAEAGYLGEVAERRRALLAAL